jgi:hypothetical protein
LTGPPLLSSGAAWLTRRESEFRLTGAKEWASAPMTPRRSSGTLKGSVQTTEEAPTVRFRYKQVIPVLAAGAAAVAIAAAPTAMAEPAAVQQPSTTTPVAVDGGSHGGGGWGGRGGGWGGHGGGPMHRYQGNCQASPLYGQVGQFCRD